MNKYLLKSLVYFKFIISNLKNKTSSTPNKNSNIILIEFNAFQIIHVVYSVFCNFYFKKDHSTKFIAYYNYDVLVSNINKKIFNDFFWFFGKIFWLKNFGIYRSFGVDSFIRPKLNDHNLRKSKKIFEKK